ncbi:Hypothetical protein NTJ_16174 [Nesidiocoris tenuis]|uniref:Uncharacterized protein n=1 Tax=Nesidiocoris tenuis TaxID=355587 RepID=A0ABN7BG79_9HEMI|nr:Hypothetical protein NTJ_16174 [Nesidiocoris tenuis]
MLSMIASSEQRGTGYSSRFAFSGGFGRGSKLANVKTSSLGEGTCIRCHHQRHDPTAEIAYSPQQLS